MGSSERFSMLVATAAFFFFLGETSAQDIHPYAGQFGGSEAGPEDLVETIWSDPDWVLATSDRILRSTVCVSPCQACPECWYDRVELAPCYPENKFWKFAQDATSAFVCTMAPLAVGSFDGLFIREGISFQIFASDCVTPVTVELTGPKFLTPEIWQDLACDGFDPGTIFLAGGKEPCRSTESNSTPATVSTSQRRASARI